MAEVNYIKMCFNWVCVPGRLSHFSHYGVSLVMPLCMIFVLATFLNNRHYLKLLLFFFQSCFFPVLSLCVLAVLIRVSSLGAAPCRAGCCVVVGLVPVAEPLLIHAQAPDNALAGRAGAFGCLHQPEHRITTQLLGMATSAQLKYNNQCKPRAPHEHKELCC